MPNGEGFTKWEYLELVMDDIDRQLKLGIIDENTALQYRTYYRDLLKTTSDPALLPDWENVRAQWVTAKGEVIVPNRVMRLPDGTYYDLKGNPISPDTATKEISGYFDVNKGKMTAGERARLDFQIKQAKQSQARWEKEQAFTERKFALEQQAERGRPRKTEAQIFEEARRGILGGLGGPSDWIRRWQVTKLQNPFEKPTDLQSVAEEGLFKIQEARADLATSLKMDGDKAISSPWLMAPSLGEKQERLTELYQEYGSAIQEQQALAQEAEKTGEFPGQQARTPPAPEWLSKFVPGQVAGQPITKVPTTTPSGQQWARTPWSQREGLRGFTEFAGFRPFEDIMGSMFAMMPQEPRGVRAKQWLPQRQRTFA